MEQKVVGCAEMLPPRINQSHFIGTHNYDKNVSWFIPLAKYTHSTASIGRIMNKKKFFVAMNLTKLTTRLYV